MLCVFPPAIRRMRGPCRGVWPFFLDEAGGACQECLLLANPLFLTAPYLLKVAFLTQIVIAARLVKESLLRDPGAYLSEARTSSESKQRVNTEGVKIEGTQIDEFFVDSLPVVTYLSWEQQLFGSNLMEQSRTLAPCRSQSW